MGGSEMSERDKAMAEAIGSHVVERLLKVAESPEATSRILDTWASQIQQAVGRAVLRVIIYLAIGCVSFLALSDRVTHAIKDIFK